MTLAAVNLAVPGRLSDLSLELRPVELTVILGPNGAGKSTLLAALAGLEPGPVFLNGAALSALPARERAQAIGYLPQTGELAWNLSVETLASLGRLPWRTDTATDAAFVEQALAALDLLPLRQRPLMQLSGGERARALLARVLTGDPDWILADEPLASLDLAHQQALLHHFETAARAGKGVVLVLHDLALAMNHADRVIVLREGRVIADGNPADMLDEKLIEQVWGIKGHWLGERGAQALAV